MTIRFQITQTKGTQMIGKYSFSIWDSICIHTRIPVWPLPDTIAWLNWNLRPQAMPAHECFKADGDFALGQIYSLSQNSVHPIERNSHTSLGIVKKVLHQRFPTPSRIIYWISRGSKIRVVLPQAWTLAQVFLHIGASWVRWPSMSWKHSSEFWQACI